MDITAILLNNLRILLGFLLVLIIPGYLISLLFFQKSSDIGIVERLVYSAVMSIGSVIVCVLFMDVFLGIDTTPLNIVIILTAFCLLLVILWIILQVLHFFSVSEKVAGWITRISAGPFHALFYRMKSIAGKIFHRD